VAASKLVLSEAERSCKPWGWSRELCNHHRQASLDAATQTQERRRHRRRVRSEI